MESTSLIGKGPKYQMVPDVEEAGEDGANSYIADLYSRPNWALLMSYVNVGFALNFLSTPVSYYLVDDLDAASSVTNTYSALLFLPWCLKIFFGVSSDVFPIMGMHRRPYFIFGWVVSCTANLVLWLIGTPGIAATLTLSFVQTFGQLWADTVADGMIVEATEYEVQERKGRMRTQGYLVRSVGTTVGGLCGACLYNSSEWGWGLSIAQCFLLQALLPALTVLPLVPFMIELPFRGKLVSVWETAVFCYNWVRIDAIWLPAMYLYLYNFCYISNPSWYNFLYDGLGFSDFEVGMMYTFSALLGFVGIWLFDTFFFDKQWTLIYIYTTIASAFFSGLQLMLAYKTTFGIPDIFFATGDISLQSAVQYITFMPMCIMYLSVIPPGFESTLYSMITTWENVATESGYDVGTLMECFVTDVGNDELANGDFNGVITLTYITTAIQILPVFFVRCEFKGVRWVPENSAMVRAQHDVNKVDDFGATLFTVLFFGSIAFSLGESLWIIVYPEAC